MPPTAGLLPGNKPVVDVLLRQREALRLRAEWQQASARFNMPLFHAGGAEDTLCPLGTANGLRSTGTHILRWVKVQDTCFRSKHGLLLQQ